VRLDELAGMLAVAGAAALASAAPRALAPDCAGARGLRPRACPVSSCIRVMSCSRRPPSGRACAAEVGLPPENGWSRICYGAPLQARIATRKRLRLVMRRTSTARPRWRRAIRWRAISGYCVISQGPHPRRGTADATRAALGLELIAPRQLSLDQILQQLRNGTPDTRCARRARWGPAPAAPGAPDGSQRSPVWPRLSTGAKWGCR